MLLEQNRKASRSKHTRHININQIVKGEVQVEWCPTQDMVANFMTKPLQDLEFKKFDNRNSKVMTHDLVLETNPHKRSVLGIKDL